SISAIWYCDGWLFLFFELSRYEKPARHSTAVWGDDRWIAPASLRGAKRRSNPSIPWRRNGLLRFARNHGWRRLRSLLLRLPLSRSSGPIDLDRDRQRLGAAAIAGTADGRGAQVVEPDRDTGVRIGGADAVGGVEADPAEVRHVGFRPG